MFATIHNPYAYPLTTGVGTVVWNNDKGHQTGSDKTLLLNQIAIGSTTVWSGTTTVNDYIWTWSAPGTLAPLANTTIVFTFHQSYDNLDGTEYFSINITTNGCNGIVIHS